MQKVTSMSSIRRLTPVVLSLTVSLTAGLRSAAAEDAVVQQFGDWKITIQPAGRKEAALIPPSPAAVPMIRLVSQTETSSVDQILDPPAPSQPENLEIIAEPAPAAGIVTAPNGAAPPCRSVDSLALVQLYPQVYNSIPFSRAEYAAYPSYRHDATMEFLFGQMRTTVIQRGTTVVNHRYQGASMPSFAPYSPYGFNSYYYPFYTGYHQPYSLW